MFPSQLNQMIFIKPEQRITKSQKRKGGVNRAENEEKPKRKGVSGGLIFSFAPPYFGASRTAPLFFTPLLHLIFLIGFSLQTRVTSAWSVSDGFLRGLEPI